MDQYVRAISYTQTVVFRATDNDENNKPAETIHIENGLFFHLVNGRDCSQNKNATKSTFNSSSNIGKSQQYTIARSASMPHGNTALLLGSHHIHKDGPILPTTTTSISAVPHNIGRKAPPEYSNPCKKALNVEYPAEYLQKEIALQNIASVLGLGQ